MTPRSLGHPPPPTREWAGSLLRERPLSGLASEETRVPGLGQDTAFEGEVQPGWVGRGRGGGQQCPGAFPQPCPPAPSSPASSRCCRREGKPPAAFLKHINSLNQCFYP